jgi:hypothetical protein
MTKVPGEVYIVQEGLEIMQPRCSHLSRSNISTFAPQLFICSSTCLSLAFVNLKRSPDIRLAYPGDRPNRGL